MRIREISQTRVRFGYRRIHVMLLREGFRINVKRVYRIYREEGLNLRRKLRKRMKSLVRTSSPEVPESLNDCWAMDFVSYQLYNGNRFRTLIFNPLGGQKMGAGHIVN